LIRVAVVDDEQLVRSGFSALLDATSGLEVVGAAADGAAAVRLVKERVPDVVLMDLRMPHVDGIEAIRQIRTDSALSTVRVLVLTTFDTDDLVYDALHTGASGFLVKDTDPEVLIDSIRRVAAGEVVLSPDLLGRIVESVIRARPRERAHHMPPWVALLTPRERDVLVEVARGLTNAEIGRALHISAATAKTHVGALFAKTGARDRVGLVLAAYGAGLAGH
jgi:DNA-binding NarL/FixJ family response regulator